MSVDHTHTRTKQCSAVPPGGTTAFSPAPAAVKGYGKPHPYGSSTRLAAAGAT